MEENILSFEGLEITLDEVMDEFDMPGKEFYEEIAEDLLEDAIDEFHPFACYKKHSVASISENEVRIGNTIFTGTYLAKRLEGVDDVYCYMLTIGEDLWQKRTSAEDAVEELIFDGLMKACLNAVLEKTASQIVGNLPDKMGIFMDNPGNLAGWELEEQKGLIDLLKDLDHDAVIKVDEKNLFDNSFSLAGIIYAKGKTAANCTYCPKDDCSHRRDDYDKKKLVAHLHASSSNQ